MPISQAREHISEIVGKARYAGEPTILTHHGQQVAVVVSIDDYRAMKGEQEAYWRRVEAALDMNPELKAKLNEPVDAEELSTWDDIR